MKKKKRKKSAAASAIQSIFLISHRFDFVKHAILCALIVFAAIAELNEKKIACCVKNVSDFV